MAFPTSLKVLGPALTSVAEGIQAVPQYVDKDEELAERHEERLAKRELRPLTLEEARLRLQKTREEIDRPKPISAGAHGSYVFNPQTRKYEFDAQSAKMGGAGETAVIRTMRTLYGMANDASNPQLAAAAKGRLDTMSGYKDTANLQSMRRYFAAMDRGEEPLPEDTQNMQIIVNRSIRGSAEGGYYPLNAPLPGATGQTPQAPPQAPGMPAPGAAGVESRVARAILGNESSGDRDISPKGAASKWQIMPDTARPYLPAYMQQLPKEQIQEALVKYPGLANDVGMKHLGALQAKYPGRPDLVAAAYFSGEGNIKDGKIVDETLSDGNMTVRQYVDAFTQRYNGQTPAPRPGGQPGQRPLVPAPGMPPPGSATPAALPPVTITAPAAQPGQPGITPLTGPTSKRIAETTATERRARGLPAYTHDEVAMAKRLASRGLIASSDLATMNDADFTKIQDFLDQKKQEPLFQRRVKEAEGQIGALDSIEMAERVSADLFPLLNTQTVGLGGLLSRAWTTVGSNLGLIKDPYERQTLKQAVDSTETLLKMARQRGDINVVLAENPKAAEALVNPGAQGVQVIAGVLEYLHAAALKKSAAAAGGRSTITVEDIRRATALFDPTSLYTDPIGSKKKIVTLQATFLRPEKEVVSKALRLKGIDPVTRKPVKSFHFSPEPDSDVQPRTAREIVDDIDESQ